MRIGLLPGSRRRAAAAAAVFLAAAVLCAGCSTSFVRRSVEKRLRARLAFWLGPADRYRVRILGTRDARLVRGRASRVEIEGDRILARGQMMVESLRLVLEDLRYEGGDPEFVSVRRSDLEIEFTEGALNEYLTAFHSRYEPEIRFEPDRVRVRMTYSFLGTPTTLRATGRLVVRDGRQLLFEADDSEVPFVRPGEFENRFVEGRINPLLDLERLEFPARLETVQVLQGRIRARGTAAIRQEL